jgi:ribose 5-phosphate isomerase A
VSHEHAKARAAHAALAEIHSGMKVGLGTGSTAAHFVEALAARARAGLEVVCVPTSEQTRKLAAEAGLKLATLDEVIDLDVTVDGADELDGALNLIKGGGGALLREKIVATSSRRLVVIADDSKQVAALGRFPLPVEVAPFGVRATARKIDRALEWAGCPGPMTIRVREAKPFITDNGNLIIDCASGRIADPERAAAALSSVPGVVCHGLFLKLAKRAYIGTPDGVSTLNV